MPACISASCGAPQNEYGFQRGSSPFAMVETEKANMGYKYPFKSPPDNVSKEDTLRSTGVMICQKKKMVRDKSNTTPIIEYNGDFLILFLLIGYI